MRRYSLCSAIGVTLGFALKIWRAIREIAPYCAAGDEIEVTATITMHEAGGMSCWTNIRDGMK